MKHLAVGAGLFMLTVLGAHGLAFVMLKGLPDPAVAALGLQSSQTAARAAYEAQRPLRTYPQVLADLGRGNLGVTVDGVLVAHELRSAAMASGPRMATATALLLALLTLTAFAPRATLRPIARSGTLLAFFPPFTAPFVALGFLMFAGGDPAGFGGPAAAICIALPPAALLCAQAAGALRRNLDLPFAINIRALGASHTRLRVRLASNLAMELAPTLEKVAVGFLAALLFVEPVLGLDGFGALALRAIRRSDPDLVLAVVLVSALTVATLRVLAVAVRRALGVPTA